MTATSKKEAKIERRSLPPRSASLIDLPFVSDIKVGPRKTKRSFWHVPPTDDYDHAFEVGAHYAFEFVQYLKKNLHRVDQGELLLIVSDMEKYADTPEKGYAKGFFALLNSFCTSPPPTPTTTSIAEKDEQRYAELNTDRETEG